MHPADTAILRLVRDERERPAPDDRSLIINRISTATFSRETHTAAEWCRFGTDVVGAAHPSCQGQMIAADTRLTACEVHVAKRILDERWEPSTTPTEYVEDMRSAARHPESRLHIGEKPPADTEFRRGQNVAATLTHMGAAGLELRKAKRKPGHALFVVYDAGKSALATGYSEPEPVVHTLVKRWKRHRVIAKVG